MNKQFIKGEVKTVLDGKIMGAVASTGNPDRDGDVIAPSGWELEAFKKNPILLWSHDASQLPIGKVTDIRTEGNSLVFDAVVAKANEFGQKVFKLMGDGILNSFSVGFIPKEMNDNGEISKAELLEISAVNVPANAEARVSKAYKEFMKEVDGTKELEKKVDKLELKIKTLESAISDLDKATDTQVVTEKVNPVVRQDKEKSEALRLSKVALRATELLRNKLKQ